MLRASAYQSCPHQFFLHKMTQLMCVSLGDLGPNTRYNSPHLPVKSILPCWGVQRPAMPQALHPACMSQAVLTAGLNQHTKPPSSKQQIPIQAACTDWAAAISQAITTWGKETTDKNNPGTNTVTDLVINTQTRRALMLVLTCFQTQSVQSKDFFKCYLQKCLTISFHKCCYGCYFLLPRHYIGYVLWLKQWFLHEL